jgi:hypothetical protein
MSNSDNLHESVQFSTMKLEPEESLRRCGLCGGNPSFFAYRKHSVTLPGPEEHGYCCTACAFTILMHLAADEVKEWALPGRAAEPRGRL